MLKGIAFPARPNSKGGFAIAEGDQYVIETILKAISPNYSEHPFEVLPMPEDTIFAVDDELFRTRQTAAIKDAFVRLENLGIAKLAKRDPIQYSVGEKEGEVVIEVRFVNLQTQQEGVVTRLVQLEA